MINKFKNILIFTSLSLTLGMGQQFGLNSLYSLDPYIVNTATAGLEGKSIISLSYRNQWEKLIGSPRLIQANYTSPIKLINGAFGLSFMLVEAGLIDWKRINASYNQVITSRGILFSNSLGLKYDFANLNYDAVRTPEGEYTSVGINHNDPNLLDAPLSQSVFGLSLATYIQTKVLEGGLELNIPVHTNAKGKRAFLKSEKIFKIYIKKEFIIDNWTISASLLDITDFVENQEEVQVNLKYRNQFSGGLLFRGFRPSSLDAIGAQFAFNVSKGVWLAYYLELPLNVLKNNINSINQQFGVKFELGVKDPQKRFPIIYNPRW